MSGLNNQYIIAQEEHDYNKKYEEGTIVKHTIDNNVTTYVAKKNVPQFTSILNENYWKKIASTEEGGTVDYDNLKNKPSINGVELEGNVTTKDLGIDNKFKGWYNTLAELKAAHTASEGYSAYVKDAFPATTWSIYVYDSTAFSDNYWADSGTDADTSNVQTFASSQEVNEVHIVNDLTTGGTEDVLSAEQGKDALEKISKLSNQFNYDFNGAKAVEIRGDIRENNNTIIIDSRYQDSYLAIPVKAGDNIKIIRNDSYSTFVYFVKDLFPYPLDTQPLLMSTEEEYSSKKTIAAKDYQYVYIVPSDVKYVLVYSKASSGVSLLPKSLEINNIDVLKDLTTRFDEKVQYDIDLSDSITTNGIYTSSGGTNTNAKFKRTLVPVCLGDIVTTNYRAESSYTYVYDVWFDENGVKVGDSFRPVDNFEVTEQIWNLGARYVGVSYRLAGLLNGDSTPSLIIQRNYGKTAVGYIDTGKKEAITVKFEDDNYMYVYVYDEQGRKLEHRFIRYYKKWDSLEYTDDQDETQIATDVVSSDIWSCDEIRYNNNYLVQGNTNFITMPSESQFHCGNVHGLEVIKYIRILVDGKDYDISTDRGYVNGSVFKMILISDIYQSDGGGNSFSTQKPKLNTSGNPIILFEHYMEVTIESNNDVTIDNVLTIKQDGVSFMSCDAAMQDVNFGDLNKVIISGGDKVYINDITDEGVLSSVGGTDVLIHNTAIYGNKVEMYGKGFYVSQEISSRMSNANYNILPYLYDNRLKCYLFPVLCSLSPTGTVSQVFNNGDVIATQNIRHILLSNDIS